MLIGGEAIDHEPVAAPWGPRRGCVHIADGTVRVGAREQFENEPADDLLHAGPLLVSDGRSLVDGDDREGFSSGAAQFDPTSRMVPDRDAHSGSAMTSC